MTPSGNQLEYVQVMRIQRGNDEELTTIIQTVNHPSGEILKIKRFYFITYISNFTRLNYGRDLIMTETLIWLHSNS